MVTTIVVEATGIVVVGQAVDFECTLQKDAGTYNLTGKTVQATVRTAQAPATVIDALLEDHAVALGNTSTTTANGGVTLTLTAVQSALLSGLSDPTLTQAYLIQFFVVDDDFFITQLLRFQARGQMD